jgi:hypothetical protein
MDRKRSGEEMIGERKSQSGRASTSQSCGICFTAGGEPEVRSGGDDEVMTQLVDRRVVVNAV